MRFAIIENGVVVNTVIANEPLGESWVASDTASIGHLWDGKGFTPPPAQAPEIPQSVTMRQARLALLGVGLLDQVTAAIASVGQAAQIEWEYATEVQRASPLIAQLAPSLDMTDEQMDGLFVLAATL